MGFFSFLAGLQDVACVTITFQETGNHRITVEREPGAPPWLDGPVLRAVLFLHYTAKALHALGRVPQSTNCATISHDRPVSSVATRSNPLRVKSTTPGGASDTSE